MIASFSRETQISAPVVDVFDYHRRATALQRLTPPWESVQVLEKSGGIENEGTLLLRIGMGPVKTQWKAEHRDYSVNKQFTDAQLKGPFKFWRHVHSFRSISAEETVLNDLVKYQLPMRALGRLLGAPTIRKRLEQRFIYRHIVTQNDLRHYRRFKNVPKLRIAITGGNGLIGSALAVFLSTQGHEVAILSRSGQSRVIGIRGVRWNPNRRFIDETELGEVDAWIHLAGENIAQKRWTKKRLEALRSSRVRVTRFLSDFILKQDKLPLAFISASGTGYYGSTTKDTSESASKGSGFLADLCSSWEQASESLNRAGIRRVLLRTGVVLDQRGGALAKLLPSFNLGFGGRIGQGEQLWSWIVMDDLLRIYDTALQDSSIEGVYNATSPLTVTNEHFAKTLGSVLNRPAILPVPAFVLRTALGKMADEALLTGQKVIPQRLERYGFQFDFPELSMALRHCLGFNSTARRPDIAGRF